MKKYKRLLLMAGLVTLVFVLSACGTAPVSESSTGIWDRYIVYYFAQAIKFLSLGGSVGIGIILFTLVIRIILLPLMHFQTKSMRKTQELQPQLKALQQKYSSKDPETQRLFREEQQRLYAENNVNPYIGCLPLLVQLPIMMALYQAISRVPELKEGTFMWLSLDKPDPYLILPILAAVFTFVSFKYEPTRNKCLTENYELRYASDDLLYGDFISQQFISLLGGLKCLPNRANIVIKQSIQNP